MPALLTAQGPRAAPLPQQLDSKAARQRLEGMFRSHHKFIWRTLRRLGLSPDQAGDTTQQAYLIAAERLSNIREGCERAYLFSTAIRLAKTNFRRNRRCQLDGDMDARVDARRHTEQIARTVSARQMMDRVFEKSPPELTTIFVLYELEGLSTPEIAEMLEIPVGTAASRLRRARQTFRAAAQRMEQASPKGPVS